MGLDLPGPPLLLNCPEASWLRSWGQLCKPTSGLCLHAKGGSGHSSLTSFAQDLTLCACMQQESMGSLTSFAQDLTLCACTQQKAMGEVLGICTVRCTSKPESPHDLGFGFSA